jgi:hypothetical protein
VAGRGQAGRSYAEAAKKVRELFCDGFFLRQNHLVLTFTVLTVTATMYRIYQAASAINGCSKCFHVLPQSLGSTLHSVLSVVADGGTERSVYAVLPAQAGCSWPRGGGRWCWLSGWLGCAGKGRGFAGD